MMPERVDQIGEDGFALVLNLLDVRVPAPVEVIPGHVLRRPTAAEVEAIREGIRRFADQFPENYIRIFEEQREGTPGGGYWVISSGTNHVALHAASILANAKLPCSLVIQKKAGKWNFGMHGKVGASSFYALRDRVIPAIINETTLQRISELYSILDTMAVNDSVRRSVYNFIHLINIGRDNPWYPLGVFSVIESVLTHNPKGEYDSLSHQISSKMRLLNKRFDSPLDQTPFGGMDFNKTWNMLYKYRSCIAHGSVPNFRKELQALRDSTTALDYLDEAARKLLCQSLKEPDLIKDLQQC